MPICQWLLGNPSWEDQCVCHNVVVRECIVSSLPFDTLDRFLSELQATFDARTANSEDTSPKATFDALLNRASDPHQLHGRHINTSQVRLARIAPLAATLYWIDTGRLGLKNDRFLRKNIRALLETRPEAIRGTMRNARGFCWVSTLNELDAVLRSSRDHSINRPPRDQEPQPVDALKDRLGLHGEPPGEPWYMFAYSNDKTDHLNLRKPSTLDAGYNALFRPHIGDQWGRALDLATGQYILREAVHGPVHLDGTFEIRPLGQSNEERDLAEDFFQTLFDDLTRSSYATT